MRANFSGALCLVLVLCGVVIDAAATVPDNRRPSSAEATSASTSAEPIDSLESTFDAADDDADADDSDADSSDMYDIGSDEVDSSQRAFAIFRDNFITKEAAERLHKMLAARTTPLSQSDYDDLLASVVEHRKPPHPPQFNKKYFDYLPANEADQAIVALEPFEVDFEPLVDDEGGAAVAAGESSMLMQPAPQLPDEDVVAVNRAKRDLYGDQRRSFERQRRLLDAQFEQNWRTTQRRAEQLAAEANRWAAEAFNAGNPWSNRFYAPGPTNVYLPVAHPPPPPAVDYVYYYPSPAVPFEINRPGGHNVGVPPHNKPPAGVVPLPGAEGSTKAPLSTIPDLSTRIGDFGDDDDDRPVWGSTPISNTIPGSVPRNSPPPARPANQPAAPAFELPPLLHNSDFEDYIPPRPSSNTATTRRPIAMRPMPDLLHNSDDPSLVPPPRPLSIPRRPLDSSVGTGRDSSSSSTGSNTAPVWSFGRVPDVQATNSRTGSGTFNRPFPPPPTQAPRAPAAVTGPTYCVWAIVDCCSHRSGGTRQACFERIGCNGSIWDVDPCSDAVVDAAVNEAEQYFN